MLESIISVISWLRTLWDSMPKETKEQIVKKVVDEASVVFEKYYSAVKENAEAKS